MSGAAALKKIHYMFSVFTMLLLCNIGCSKKPLLNFAATWSSATALRFKSWSIKKRLKNKSYIERIYF